MLIVLCCRFGEDEPWLLEMLSIPSREVGARIRLLVEAAVELPEE
jgi:hypothetical protein